MVKTYGSIDQRPLNIAEMEISFLHLNVRIKMVTSIGLSWFLSRSPQTSPHSAMVDDAPGF